VTKPKTNYAVRTPAGNNAILTGEKREKTKYTMQNLTGKALQELLNTMSPMQVEKVQLFEVKQQLFMKPVTSIVIETKDEVNGKISRKR